MNVTRFAILLSAICGVTASAGAMMVNVFVTHDGPAPQIIQQPVDEARIANLVAERLIADRDAKLATEKAKHRKADCAFWGKGMEGCS